MPNWKTIRIRPSEYRFLRALVAFNQGFKCVKCNKKLEIKKENGKKVTYDLHHIKNPNWHHPDNLQCLHRECHESIHERPLNDF
jgi:hypothetical protein